MRSSAPEETASATTRRVDPDRIAFAARRRGAMSRETKKPASAWRASWCSKEVKKSSLCFGVGSAKPVTRLCRTGMKPVCAGHAPAIDMMWRKCESRKAPVRSFS